MSLSLTAADAQDDDDDDESPMHLEDFRDENIDDEDLRVKQIARTHYLSTAAICFCSFTHSWLLVSVFPYSGFLVIRLVPNTNEENAGSYAGLLAASFMIGRAVTSYGWGKVADLYGRKIVYYTSLSFSAFFSIMFGLSSSFGLAMVWRFLLGAGNGIAGVNKIIVSETAKGIERLETRGMSVSMGMWAWGFLLSPALSGFLSDPVRQYPNLGMWTSHPFVYRILEAHPFLLPNLVSVFLCTVDIIMVMLLVPETLPPTDRRSALFVPRDCLCWLASLGGTKRSREKKTNNNNNSIPVQPNQLSLEDEEEESLLLASAIELIETERDRNANGTTTNLRIDPQPEVATLSYLWNKKDTRNHLMVFWMISFVGIAIDEAIPLFCLSKEGGLGLEESDIGKVLSASGFFFAISQYHVYSWIVDKYGICKSIKIGAMCSAPLVTLVPLAMLLQQQNQDDSSSLSRASFWYLSLLLSWMRIFGLVFFSSITIAANRTVVPSHRGTMNGLSMLGGSIAKGLGPIAAGLCMSFGISSGVFAPRIGSSFVFVLIGIISMTIAFITVCLLGEQETTQETTPMEVEIATSQRQHLRKEEEDDD